MNLINEIILALTDSRIQIQDTLLKIKVLAAKINNKDLINFVNGELEGYEGKIPDYRIYKGQIIGNCTNGHMNYPSMSLPTAHLEPKTYKDLTSCEFYQSIGTLNEYLNINEEKITKTIPIEYHSKLSKGLGNGYKVYSAWVPIDKGVISGVLTKIRSKLLDLMVEIEQSFSEEIIEQLFIKPDEPTKKAANKIVNNYIKNIFTSSNDSKQNVKIEQGIHNS